MTQPWLSLGEWLNFLVARFANPDYRPTVVEGPFGHHGVSYTNDDDLHFASVGFTLPADTFAEIEDGTYGSLQAFRIALDVPPPYTNSTLLTMHYELVELSKQLDRARHLERGKSMKVAVEVHAKCEEITKELGRLDKASLSPGEVGRFKNEFIAVVRRLLREFFEADEYSDDELSEIAERQINAHG